MVQPTNKSGKGCLIAILVVFALFAIGAVLSVIAIAYFGEKASDKLEDVGDALSTPSTIDASDPGARSEDEVLDIGESVDISGFTATVRSANFVDEVEGFGPGNYLVLDVTIENRDDQSQSPFGEAWTLQQPDGLVVPPIRIDGSIAGSMAGGATASGVIVFQVRSPAGEHFVLYRPDIINESRGVWPVSP
jgi:hypothetical protein